ncbi:DNA repair protein RecO [Aliiglaciecola sp. CAU 1673]|uniref:DNA repair protein RecO n=1 Tax=Aliiglaciecola sp. CAU 1673 TaxID=3032595 RepID=UPI0023DB74D4|nr:DNA repair protein RecO [Aliiglaciecola sp. CAU 1673]MDF2178346.1 DNA repair protein RecO [Aliiglaciecola sp. CAU 1673]
MNSGLCQAFVLHRRPYRETSFLVDIFSAEQGRQSLVAKGVRSAKSANRSLLQPFQPIELCLVGKHELKTLRSVESAGQHFQLQGNALFCGLYLNELLQRLLPSELPFPALFHAYQQCLQQLCAGEAIEPILREYELLLLSQLGYELDFVNEAESGAPIEPLQRYRFEHEMGFVRVLHNAPVCFEGDQLLAIGRADWHPQSLKAAKLLTRLALRPLLGDKPLKSRELFISGQ